MRTMFNLKDRDFKDLETFKGVIKKYFREQKIGIEAEISEDILREVFSEAKEKIAEKTDYKVEKIEFPNMFAVLLYKRDLKKFKATVWDSMDKEARKKSIKVFLEEHGEKLTKEKFINKVPAFSTPFEEDESFYFVAAIKEKSLKHELTHYFEVSLKLPPGSLLYIWE